MISVNVKLYGTLPWRFQGYDPEKGLTVQLGQGARVLDLTEKLNIAPADTGVVAIDGRVAKPEERIRAGATIRIFQVAHGG
ncbi:MAG: hypothetical protein C4519_01955 [Desulfobacteraceae bacterium]|nr:MAG: hypothetical protein C4519_01955 [Desulfobacteraceae bacterium]